MSNTDPKPFLSGNRLVPVIEIDSAAAAAELGQALAAGGITVMEVTFRTPAAAHAIEAARRAGDCVVGAGTLLAPADVDAAVDSGAQFGVMPGWDPLTAQRAADRGLPIIPGVSGAAEIQQRLAEGYRTLKFFPAEASGGAAALKMLSAPFAHRGVGFVPTGGISAANAGDYLALGSVVAVGGSWVAPRGLVNAGDFDQITELARTASRALTEEAA